MMTVRSHSRSDNFETSTTTDIPYQPMKPSGDRFSGEVQTWPSLLPTLRRREQREGVPCCYGGEDGMATSGSPGEMEEAGSCEGEIWLWRMDQPPPFPRIRFHFLSLSLSLSRSLRDSVTANETRSALFQESLFSM